MRLATECHAPVNWAVIRCQNSYAVIPDQGITREGTHIRFLGHTHTHTH